jgi:hypothetical protein
VPAGAGGAGVITADARDVTRDLFIAPAGTVDIQFKDLPIFPTARTAVTAFTLSSTLNQGVPSAAGTALMNSSNSLTFLVFDILEAKWPVTCPKCLEKCLAPGEEGLALSLGPRYASINQHLRAALTGGTAGALLDSQETFNGAGVTFAVSGKSSWWHNFRVYGTARGSVLVGGNDASGAFFAPLGAPFVNANDNRTDVVSSAELNLGIELLYRQAKLWSAPCYENDGNGHVGMRVGFLGQVWDNIGLPSAADGGRLNGGTLYLVGFEVLFHVQF